MPANLMLQKVPGSLWWAFVCAGLALAGSLFLHPMALVLLEVPFIRHLSLRRRHFRVLEWVTFAMVFSVSTLLFWGSVSSSGVSLYFVIFGMTIGSMAFVTEPGKPMSALAGLALAAALASFWIAYPTPLLVGLCFGYAIICLQIHWVETLRNAQLDLAEKIGLRTQRIRYLLRERDEVTTLAVHDLQSPIQAIAGMQKTLLHMLEQENQDKNSMRQALEVAIDTNADLSDRIGSLLNSSRDHLGGAHDTTSLSRILEGTIAAHRIALKNREISVHAPNASDVRLHNDEDVKDILDVMLDNAIKYSPENGIISIKARYQVPGDVVIIDIHDSGPGVPDSQRNSLFLAPIDKESATDRTGLGLYLASRRATRLGGTVEHLPSDGTGTVFRLSLPAIFER